MSTLPPIEIDPELFLYKHCSLPSLPKVLTDVQEIINSDDVSIVDVADAIDKDPAMVAQVLKIVNSAYYNLPNEVIKTMHAVAYLGITEVYRIVLTVSVVNTISCDDKTAFNKIWFHSLFAALIVKHLSKKFEPTLDPGELWTACILHDIGKLVYMKFFPDHYRKLEQYRNQEECQFCQAEEHFSLPSSAFIGSLLCDRWRLPKKVKEACAHHTYRDLDIEKRPEHAFRNMVTTGNILALIAENNLNETVKDELVEKVQQVLEIDEHRFLHLMGTVYELKLEIRNMMV